MESIDSVLTKIGLGRFHFIAFTIIGIVESYLAFQMMIVPLLGLLLKCHWQLTDIEVYIITTASFIGLMIGCLFIGNLSDKYGRKKTLLLTTYGIIYFGIASAFSPTIYWVIFMQLFSCAFSAGIVVTICPLLSEMFPPKFRGIFLVALEFYWAAGTMFLTLLCYLLAPPFGWRVFLIISLIPLIFVSMAVLWVPESPRFLLLHNDKAQCLAVINRIAKMNKSEFITDIYEPQSPQSSAYDLIHPNYLLTTILTSFIFFVSALTFYSVVLIIPIINAVPHRCLQNMTTYSTLRNVSVKITVDDSCCMPISLLTFKDMFISTSAEFIFTIISLVLIYFMGRKTIIPIYQVVLTVGFFLLNFCLAHIKISVILFAIRGASLGFFILISVYATEVFPTSVRGLGLGICSFFGRVGGIIAPLIVNIVIAKYSLLGGTMALCALNIAAIISCFLLPYETKGRKIYQTASHEEFKKM